ncbi:MAG: adenylate/guanylate cyclase domain-containing protein [Nocardioidaceae bacterium]
MGSERRLVAVMFTDMQGFTALMQSDEELALAKREKYKRILEEQHEAFDGTIVQFLGDGSLSTFPNSVDAVACAIAVQKAFREPLEVPVRIGIHVGNVIVEPTGVVGDAVNIASRIESFGSPGAVMVSDSVQDQVRNQPAFEFVDLGKFKLKNVGRPFAIFAIATDGLAVPARDLLQGKGEQLASLPANLPDPATPILGREADLAALADLVAHHRVVTITGPGGIGKTRTAIEVCRRLGSEFLDGISFVALADVTDPADVVPTLAEALDIKEAEERSLIDGVMGVIGDKKALLLLDNLEQVIEAAPAVADLVAACSELRLVITSRTPLHIGAEREYQLEPLLVPPAGGESVPKELGVYSAVALFTQRAQAVNPAFTLTADNALAVAEVCRRMDGLPLAIELAAARTRLLTPEALLARLEHALDVLTGGRRDLPERQQTLRATIDWSHSLLTDAEQQLFRGMATFSAGATLDAIEATCAEPGGDVLADLESLVDKALVVLHGERLSMLQTIREFATERLEGSGEEADVAARHAAYYAGLAAKIGTGIEGTEQLAWMERGVTDEPNIQAALDNLVDRAAAGDVGAAELGMTACGDLWLFWHIRGKHLSARDYAGAFLELSTVPTRGRARVLNTAGIASWTLRQYERSLDEWSESRRIAEEVGDGRTMANATACLGLGNIGIDLDEGLSWTAASIGLGRELDYPFSLSLSLAIDGILHAISGDAATATARYQEALSIQEPRGDHEGAGLSLSGLAQLAAIAGDGEGALELYERSRAAFEAVGDRAEEARVLGEMAWTYLAHDDAETAHRIFLESAQAYQDVGSIPGIGTSMIGMAAVEAVEGRPERAVTIAAAAEHFSEEEGIVNVYSDDSPGRPYLDGARAELSGEDIDEAEKDGRNLTVREAIRMVRG